MELIYGSTGLIFPSKYEGFGIPLIEFLSVYKPIICMTNSSIPEVMGGLAHYITDSISLADMMLKINSKPLNSLYYAKVDKHLEELLALNEQQYCSLFKWIENRL